MDQAMRKYFEYCLISALIAAAAAVVVVNITG